LGPRQKLWVEKERRSANWEAKAMKKPACRATGMFAILILFGASVSGAQAEKKNQDVNIVWGVKIPMRDGIKLNATLYTPTQTTGRLPVIFALTPYTTDSYHDRAIYMARNGYAFAVVDTRGRGNSEGIFEPFANEGRDGFDIVEWVAKQPWSNGKVAMWGGSYGGFDQWATAKEFPPHLVTIVPVASPCLGVDFPMTNNIFSSDDIQWIALTSGRTANTNLFDESSFWLGKYTELFLKHMPFRMLDQVVGNPSPTFQKWLDHPTPDQYWNAMGPDAEQYARIQIPILTITGDYDGDQRGALTYYKRHMQYGSTTAKSEHFLVIGPWDHAGTWIPRQEIGGLKFGSSSLIDLNNLHKEWYDWTMKGGPKPEFLKKLVAYYVPGLEQWKYVDTYDEIAKSTMVLYLSSDGRANDVFHSGELNVDRSQKSETDKFVYDPLDVRSVDLQNEEVSDVLLDQTGALNLFGNGLVYHSAPFDRDTEITGSPKFEVWISMDVPDTDFEVLLYEVLPSGTTILISDDMLRARYRESLTQPKLVKPGEILQYEFQTFQFFSRWFEKGSRIRLVLRSPNSIQTEKNYNRGGAIADESGKDAITAHIIVYHDEQHPSRLELPVAN